MNVSSKIVILTVLQTLWLFSSLLAQNRSQLENEKREILKKIQETEKILSQTEKQTQAGLGQLSALRQQLVSRKSLVGSINKEIQYLNAQIGQNGVVIESLENDLESLKKEYASMVYTAYRSGNAFNRLTFIFSSGTFNQLILRIKYMEQYSLARKNQVELINLVRNQLMEERSNLESQRNEKQNLLNEQLAESQKIQSLQQQQNDLIAKLRTREKELKQEIDARKKDVGRLENLISQFLAAEMKKDGKEFKDLSVDVKNLSANFAKNKNRLPWPVNQGFISEHFGINAHPVYKTVSRKNDGVNIQTTANAEVKSVFAGEVKMVAVIPGDMKNVVIIQHGEYFTVYARLKEVAVKKGQQVNADQVIGKVNTDTQGVSEVQFQVWKNAQKLNPEDWLAKK